MAYKTRMEVLLKNRRIAANSAAPGLTLRKVEDPSYETYRDLHNTVGKPYGWEKRSRIHDGASITKLLATPGVELWEFYDGQTLIGYALFTCEENNAAAELEDFGFFPDYSSRGYGSFFLSRILERLTDLGIERVWLTTRSTNHSKVISFYERMGFHVVGTEEIGEG